MFRWLPILLLTTFIYLCTADFLLESLNPVDEFVVAVEPPLGVEMTHQHTAIEVCSVLGRYYTSILGECISLSTSMHFLIYLKEKITIQEGASLPLDCGCLAVLRPQNQHELSSRSIIPSRLSRRDVIGNMQFDDAHIRDQWYITENIPDTHIHVLPVWARGITGTGVKVMIVDDGVDMRNVDLATAFEPSLSYDFVNNTLNLPTSNSESTHGTKVAGVVGARKNQICGVGVAYDVKIAAARLLPNNMVGSDAREAAALSHKSDEVDIYINSWGPIDDGVRIGGPGPLLQNALVQNTVKGRNGRGNIYIFAGGNGRMENDNCNYDGYVNSIYTIAVSAINMDNKAAEYSEECSAILVTTYSSFKVTDEGTAITSTSVGEQGCTSSFTGTSVVAPIAAGIVALMLQVQPTLGWRDVMSLLVHHATPVDIVDESWTTTYNGLKYSNRYGFGKLDADKLVDAASKWTPSVALPSMKSYTSPITSVNNTIPGNKPFSSVMSLRKLDPTLKITRIEQVVIEVNITSAARGYLVYKLQSPSGIVSTLTTVRRRDDYTDKSQWIALNFSSVQFWDETRIEGDWILTILKTRDIHEDKLWHWRLWLHGVDTPGLGKTSSATPTIFKISKLITISSFFLLIWLFLFNV